MFTTISKVKARWLLGLFLGIAFGSAHAQTAQLQVIHNAADVAADTVDVWVNNDKLLPKFAFRTATPYITVPAGVELQVRIKGKNSTDTTAPLFFERYTLPTDAVVTLVANGVLNPAQYAANPNGASTAFNIAVLPGATAATTAGTAAVNVWHGSTDAPRVNVLNRAGATGVHGPVVRNFAYGSFLPQHAGLPAQDLTLEVNTRENDQTVAAFSAPLSAFADSALYVLASGFLNPAANQNGAAFGLLAVTAGGRAILLPAASNEARAQIIHASPDTGLAVVDVWVNGTRALPGVRYQQATGYIPLPAGTPIRVNFTRPNAADTTTSLFAATYTLNAGQKVALVARGVAFPGFAPNPVSSNAFNVAVIPSARPQANSTDSVTVNYFHASPDAPAVSASLNGTLAVPSLSFGQATGYVTLPANTVLNTELATVSPVVALGNFNTTSGSDSAYVVVVTGFVDATLNANGPGLSAMAVRGDGQVRIFPLRTNSIAGRRPSALAATVFPNPVRDSKLNVITETRRAGALNWRITDMAGRLIQSGATATFEAGIVQTTIDAVVNPGSYLFQITDADGRLNVTRIVVQ